jgi:hypothetical protein
MARRKVSTTIYITPEQSEQLKLLHSKTKVPVAEYIRDRSVSKAAAHPAGATFTSHLPRGLSASSAPAPSDVHADPPHP